MVGISNLPKSLLKILDNIFHSIDRAFLNPHWFIDDLYTYYTVKTRWEGGCCLPLIIFYEMLSLLWYCIDMTMDRRELLWKLIIIPTFQVSSMNGWSRETSTSCRNISDNTEAGEVSQFTQPHLMFTCAFTCSRIFTFSDVHDHCETCLNAAWN